MCIFKRLSRHGCKLSVYVGGGARDAVQCMSVGEVYRTQPELQAVVSFIAQSVAKLPLKCYLRVAEDDRPRDTEMVLPALLASPGGGVTQYELLLATISDICLYGQALGHVMSSADAPSGYEMRGIPAAWVLTIRTVNGSFPSSYVICSPDADAAPVSWPASSFVRFAIYDPGHPTVPLSPVNSLKQVLSGQASSRSCWNVVWKNDGWFSRYIERPASDEPWGREARDQIAWSMKSHFNGKDGTDYGGISILEDGMKFVETTMNAEKTEWAESMRPTREDVAGAYHINPATA